MAFTGLGVREGPPLWCSPGIRKGGTVECTFSVRTPRDPEALRSWARRLAGHANDAAGGHGRFHGNGDNLYPAAFARDGTRSAGGGG
jgi:hypothetical protein